MHDVLPKDIQIYIMTFVGKCRDSAISKQYITDDFKIMLSMIKHRIDVILFYEDICKTINMPKEVLWSIWCVQFPSLYIYYWKEIVIRNKIYFNINFKDLRQSIDHNINWLTLV